ncbi:ABC transporter permease [Austwickia chelonae]|uniref:ABC transporter permease n=1 Tax=Austwickia chelonae TaxID=100225 RepID=UPI001F077740|nr:ABC-2 family transporter protein [Austwickia chelonae]
MRFATDPYRRLFVAGFRRRTTYRMAVLAGVVTNSVFGLVRCAVLLAMAATATATASSDLAGYDAASLLSYAFITQALLGPVDIWSGSDLRDRIRTGDIAVDLARPLDVPTAFLAHGLGSSAATVIPRSLPTLAVGIAVVGVRLPTDPAVWTAGLVAIALAMLVSQLSRFLLQCAAFWITETRGLLSLYAGAAGILSGLIVPVAIMPEWLQSLSRVTPFPSLLQAPADLLSGRIAGAQVWSVLGTQLFWSVALALAVRLAFRAGTRRLVVAGG